MTSTDTTTTLRLPSYDELPRDAAGTPQAWNLFGPSDRPDNVGLLNLQTPDRVAAAARLVVKGSVFSLNAPFDLFTPPLAASRGLARHRVMMSQHPAFVGCDDVYDNVYPQGNSQWDSLAHVGFDLERFYNGATRADVLDGRRNGIDHWARRGIAGRAVLLDLAATTPGYEPDSGYAFTVADLERAQAATGVQFETGDVLVLNTGYAEWYSTLDAAEKVTLVRNLTAPGIEHSEAMCRYLWDIHAASVVTDTFAVEVWPPNWDAAAAPFGFIHQVLIGGFGLALGELWWLADLVADCRADGVFECLLVSAPLNLPGGIGSPANALAMK